MEERILRTIGAFFLFIFLYSCSKDTQLNISTMGTYAQVKICGVSHWKSSKLLKSIKNEFDRIDSKLSYYKKDSDVSRINRTGYNTPFYANTETFNLIKRCIGYSDLTKGAFDITIAPAVKKWGFFNREWDIPTKNERLSLIKHIGYHNIELNDKKKTIMFNLKGMSIDLGGVGKGYAVDRIKKLLEDNGIKNALINLGGNIYCMGSNSGNPWKIGIRDPRDKNKTIFTVKLVNMAISTSGDYEKFFFVRGERYCHIIDPRTALPVKGVVAVTIIAPQAELADALSTGVFVMGPIQGLKLIETLPEVECLITYSNGKGYKSVFSSGFKKYL